MSEEGLVGVAVGRGKTVFLAEESTSKSGESEKDEVAPSLLFSLWVVSDKAF